MADIVLTRAELDREYNNREKVPDFQASFERMKAGSDTVRADLPNQLDVAYGAGPRHKFDLFRPAGWGGEVLPLAVFIHGGYWHMLDKDLHAFVARGLTAHGFAVATVGYPLMPEAAMADLVAAVRRALGELTRRADLLAVDASAVTVLGHSAGGHLAAICGADLDDGAEYRLKRIVGLSGLYDLEPISRCYLNDTLDLSAEDVAAHSPVHLKARTDANGVVLVGGEEGAEYARQSTDLAAAWPGIEAVVLDGLNHFTIVEQLADPDSAVVRAVVS